MADNRKFEDIPKITKEKTIEDLIPSMLDYPFIYKGMTTEVYWQEREYYESNWPLVKSGNYRPLWVQNGEEHEKIKV